MISNWDELETAKNELGHLSGTWSDLGRPAGSRKIGLKRIQVDPGKWSTPVHAEGAEEELFFVLAGSGISRQNGEFYEVRPGDCLVHLAAGASHTLRAGDDGLDVLAFGERVNVQIGYLPRANVAWLGDTWVEVGAGDWPWAREVAVGEPEVTEVIDRPESIVNLEEVESEHGWRDLGRAGGSLRTGLKHVTVPPGQLHCPPHCHSADEELFVVLEGEGVLELTPSPGALEGGRVPEEHAVREGSIVSRLPATGMAHGFRAGDRGLTLLAYGTKDPNDIAYYPRSNKIYFRGVGVMAQLDHVGYTVGEESTT